jgi:PAS domain S-box-containing protein
MKRQPAEWYARVLNALDDFVLVKGPRSRLIWANKAFREFYGMSNEDLESLVDSEHSDADDTLQYVIDDHSVFTSGTSRTVVEAITKHDGMVGFFETIKVPMRDRDGAIVGTIGTSRPCAPSPDALVSEGAREDRKTSMSMLRELVMGMPLPVIVVDRANRVVVASQAAELLFAGHKVEGPLSEDLGALVPELMALVALGDGEPIRQLEAVAVPELGLRLNIEARPWPLPTRGMGGVLITFHDVTQLIAAQERLQASNAELEARQAELESILDVADVGIVVADAAGQFQVVNGAARSMFGGQPLSWEDQGSGPSIHFEQVPDDDVVRERWPLASALRGVSRREQPYKLIRSDETQACWVVASSVPLPEWSRYAAVLVLYDVTRMVRVQQELEEFAFVASHDLREPLRMVTGFVRLLQERLAGTLDEESTLYMNFVIDGSTRMNQMVRDVLTVSREQNRSLEMERVSLTELLAEIVDDLQVAVEEADATVTVGSLPLVSGDRSQLKRLFMNLLSNGLKFRADDRAPIVHVEAVVVGSETRITVADNGIGIAEEHREIVFGMFNRLHAQGKFSGNGLGLALCKRIVDRHNGRIRVGVNEPNGAIVTVVLPTNIVSRQ